MTAAEIIINYRRATVSDQEGIRALYEDWGYTHGIALEDLIWVADADAALIGVCRVAPEQGTFVFRGLYVLDRYRGQGVGRTLARTALAVAGIPECYCLPERHLVAFYKSLGFREVAITDAPSFLAERMSKYRNEGYDAIIMLRAV